MIRAYELCKTYRGGKTTALDHLSLEVHEGELFGLIGPDGAGKTTLIKILTSLLVADGGTAEVMGLDVRRDFLRIRSIAGYMPATFSLYTDLTVQENLKFFASLFNTGVEDNYELIRDLYEHIAPFANRRAGKLSGGMKQKLALCCALIHRPRVLFLDEPSTGVDPVSRRDLWNMLARLKKDGMTILVSTPYMDEATECDRVALMCMGRIADQGTPRSLVRSFSGKLYAAECADNYSLLMLLRHQPEVRTCFAFGHSLHLTLHHDDAAAGLFTRITHTVPDLLYRQIDPNIEDYYMQL